MINTQYERLLVEVMRRGVFRDDRTGIGTRSIFDATLRYNLADGFPVVTTKKIHFKSVVGELLWFLQGNTNTTWLKRNGIRIWDEWADERGDLGPVYGKQWRAWATANGAPIDQITCVIDNLRTDPYSRRHIVSAWNVADLPRMALAPCHMLFQFYVHDEFDEVDGVEYQVLSCKVTQRSADLFLGVPFNIASYALLTHMVARAVGMRPGVLVWSGGDVHIYDNHLDQVSEQIRRDPFRFPLLELAERDSIFDYEIDDVKLLGYQHHPAIKGLVAV